MRKSIKKLISAVLLNVMLLSIILPCITVPVEAAGDTLYYWLTEKHKKGINISFDPLITREMLGNTQFRNQFLKSNYGSNLAVIIRMTTARGNLKDTLWFDQQGRLLYDREYKHDKDSDIKWYANFDWGPAQYTKQLAANKELKLYLEANLAADKHNNFIHHRGTMLNDRAEIQVTTLKVNNNKKETDKYLGNIINKDTDGDEIFYNHSNEFQLDDVPYINFRLGSTACGCGSSKVKSVIAAIVDEKSPTIKEAQILNKDKEPTDYIAAGAKGIVSLIFSEPMRFADHEAKPLKIYLDLYDRKTESSIDTKLEAILVSLDENILNFEFIVPEKIEGKDTDVYIRAISGTQPITTFNTAETFDLVSLAKYDTKGQIYANKLNVKDGVNLPNINKSKSAITDLAGNPVTWNRVVNVNRAYLDGVVPEVEGLDLILSENKAPTYAGVGSKIEGTLFFSERMKFENPSMISSVRMTLNLKDKLGNPVVLTGKEFEDIKNSLNRPTVTAIYFKPITIEEGMILTEGNRIKVTEISLPDGLRDLAGINVNEENKVTGEAIPTASQEIILDVTPPVIGSGAITYSSDYPYEKFLCQFAITDSGSGVIGKKGKFAWVDTSEYKDFNFNNIGKPFLYAFSSNGTEPDAGDFKTGWISDKDNIQYVEFLQSENNFLHIRAEVEKENAELLILSSELYIVGVDRAENGSEVKKVAIDKPFKWDEISPTVELGEHYITTDNNEIKLNVPVVVSDDTGVKEIHYKWEGDADYNAFGLTNENTVYASHSITLSKTVAQGVYGTDDLTVYAVDVADNSGKDMGPHVNSSFHRIRSYNYNTKIPATDFGPNPRDPKDLNIIGPSLFIDRPKETVNFPKATTAIMARNPFVSRDSEWDFFVYFLSNDDNSLKEGEAYKDFFEKYRGKASWNANDFDDWYTGKFYIYEKLIYIKPLTINEFNVDNNKPTTRTEQFAAMFGGLNLEKSRWHHYGDLEIRVITVADEIDVVGALEELTAEEIEAKFEQERFVGVGNEAILENKGIRFDKFPNKTTLTMRSADPLGIDEEDDPDSIYRLYDGYKFLLDDYDELETYTFDGETVHWFRPDIKGDENDKDKDLNKKPVTVSLEKANGLKIPFAFNDGHVIFDYDDIDETKSNLKLYYTGDQASGANIAAITEGELVYEAPLYAKYGTQYFSLSINEGNVNKVKTGYYALVASMSTKSKGINDKHFSRQDLLVSDLFIDAYSPDKDDFKLSIESEYAGKEKKITTPEEGQLVGSVGCDMDWKINIEQEETESQNNRNGEIYSSNSYTNDIKMDGMYWIKVWNPDVEGSEEKAQWQHYTKDYKLKFIDNSDDTYTAFDNGVAYAPVVNGERNILLYQFCSYSGMPSGAGQFILTAGDKEKKPSFEIWRSHEEDTPSKSVVIGPTDIVAESLIEDYGLLIEESAGTWKPVEETEARIVFYEEVDEDGNTVRTVETMNYEIFQNGNYKYYIYDDYGMTGEVEIEIGNIDLRKPTIAISDNGFNDGALKFTATVTDDYSLNNGYLLVKFAGGFIEGSHLKELEKVEGEESENSDVYISIPLDSKKVSQDAFRKAGVYKLTIVDAEDGKKKTVNIEMIIGNVPESGSSSISLNAIDSVGNMPDNDSFVKTWDEGVGNDYAPAIVGDAVWANAESMVYLKFNTPVKLLSYGLSNSDYSIDVPTTISSNGIYTIEYTDIFGDTYSEFIEIDIEALKLGLDIQYDKALTNKDIELELKASDSEVNIAEVKIDNEVQNDLSLPKQELKMTITKNCIVHVTIKKDEVTSRTQAIRIDNIDKTPITAKLIWTYGEGNWIYEEGNGEDIGKDIEGDTTTAPVSVTVVGNKPLLGDLTYTFANAANKGATHTFDYSDEAGNTGSITATLRHDINFTVDDELAPGVDIKVYFKSFAVYNQGLSGSAGHFDLFNKNEDIPEGLEIEPPDYTKDSGSSIDWNNEESTNIRSQAVRLDLKITDQSATKVFLKSTNSPPQYSDAASNKVDKAELSGNSIFIDTTGETDITPQDFYIFVVDEENNWTSFLVKPGLLDKTAPKTTISKEQYGPFSAEAILKIDEEDVPYTTVTNKTGVIKHDDSTYGYMAAEDETVTFYFHDSVGNIGTNSIKVEGLDSYAPVVTSLIWSPEGTDNDKEGIQDPPTKLMKGSLLAQLTIKNPIKGAELVEGGDSVKLSFTDRKVNLIYNENAAVKIKITSQNDEPLVYSLPGVNCLDNEELVIETTKTEVAKNQRSAKLTFAPKKDNVYFVEGKQWRGENEPFDEYIVTSAKPIKLNFTDKVGNVAIVDIKEIEDSTTQKKLDFSPLKLKFNTTDSDTDAVDKLSELLKDSEGNDLKIYAKSSHKVTVEGAVEDKIDTIDTWTPLTLKKADNKATLKFTDERGDSFGTAVYFVIPDKTPPTVLLKETVISVAKDIADENLIKNLIKDSIIVSDNESKVDDDTNKLTINIDIKDVKLDELGIYKATITAEDKAKNKTVKEILIRVAPAEGLLTKIGNRFLEPNGSHILYGKNLAFTLFQQDRISTVEEPYKIYVKEELQTPGQMKSAKRFFSDDDNPEQEIKFTSTGLHTIYLQTQNRYNYIFYVYVMD